MRYNDFCDKIIRPKGQPILMDIITLVNELVTGLLAVEDKFIDKVN